MRLKAGHARGLLRYAAVGALATALHWGLLVAAVSAAHWPAWAGSGIGAVAGAQFAWAANRRLTFAHRGPWAVSWLRFQIVAVLGATVSMSVVALAVALGLHYLAGQALATAGAMLATYTINRRWSFPPARPGPA